MNDSVPFKRFELIGELLGLLVMSFSQYLSGLRAEHDTDNENQRTGACLSAQQNGHAHVTRYNRWSLSKLPAKAMHYHADDGCTGCVVCRDICPVGNTALDEGKLQFDGNCQSCVACCIQYSPHQALNYGDKTNNRGRYQNPKCSARDLNEFQHRTRTAGNKEGKPCIDSGD